ncbi:carbamoyltransferase C-terminal domain-containing protein [Streptomyces sp. AD55]|uniref:carbamoyltransferase C-terminal domain-containing protein n=1 Tax=Streptomyces sp. AD55 TaxID=3242895 RepID=UPI0035294C78
MRILGINALFHEPAAALVVDGRTVAAAEEERCSRRKHGKRPVPFSVWEMPELSARWCLEHAGVRPGELDGVACSFDPRLARPVAPMVFADRAADVFAGPVPSPYMLFAHEMAAAWRDRIPAVVHVDGTARIQTVAERREPLVARMLRGFERRTGLPVVVDTRPTTACRPMVDDPRDALECFGSALVDLLASGPFAGRRGRAFA